MPENSIERYPILNIGFNYEISYFSDQTFDIESMFEALVKSVNSLKQDIEHEKIDIHNMSAIKIYLYRFYDLLKVRVDNMIGMENTDKSTKKTEFEIKEELRKKYELKIEQDKNYITEIVKELKELKNEMNNLFIAKESEKKAKI